MKALIGTRVLLTKPVKPESTIVLSPDMEEALERDMMKKMDTLRSVCSGNRCNNC